MPMSRTWARKSAPKIASRSRNKSKGLVPWKPGQSDESSSVLTQIARASYFVPEIPLAAQRETHQGFCCGGQVYAYRRGGPFNI
jgi:hypothetical protein